MAKNIFVFCFSLLYLFIMSIALHFLPTAAIYANEQNENVRINLTSSNRDDILSVFVKVDHIELITNHGNITRGLNLAKDFGPIDLLKLQDGIELPLDKINLPQGTDIKQVRLVLTDDGNYLIRKDSSLCYLRTPSQQQSGLKILIDSEMIIEANHKYTLTVKFDTAKSLVFLGNGGCLLKPVLKLGRFVSEVDIPPAPEPTPVPTPVPTPEPTPEPEIPVEEEKPSYCEGLVFDPNDPSTWPGDYIWEDLELCL